MQENCTSFQKKIIEIMCHEKFSTQQKTNY